jgi:hypothetical protein
MTEPCKGVGYSQERLCEGLDISIEVEQHKQKSNAGNSRSGEQLIHEHINYSERPESR